MHSIIRWYLSLAYHEVGYNRPAWTTHDETWTDLHWSVVSQSITVLYLLLWMYTVAFVVHCEYTTISILHFAHFQTCLPLSVRGYGSHGPVKLPTYQFMFLIRGGEPLMCGKNNDLCLLVYLSSISKQSGSYSYIDIYYHEWQNVDWQICAKEAAVQYVTFDM